MQLPGANYVGGHAAHGSGATFRGFDPLRREPLDPAFHEATPEAVDGAVEEAERAFPAFSGLPPERRAAFLSRIADEIEVAGEALIARASAETALPLARLSGECSRTTAQLRMFADVVRDGSWVEARIDTARPDRRPAPAPDLRRMLVPLGPVAVFGASNFPLAFSVAGGDTASALAAGCSVVFKAHPAHPGTSELAAQAVLRAAGETGMPDGVFSLLQGVSHEVGQHLVTHPLIQAVGFTGSLRGGRALFDLAGDRPAPIPVYAEMGSVNPVVVLPSALEARADVLAEGLTKSVMLGVGQFCTNPGLVIVQDGPASGRFIERLAEGIREAPCGTMLYPGIQQAFEEGVSRMRAMPGVDVLAGMQATDDTVSGVLSKVDAATFVNHPELQNEVFGPSSLVVMAEDDAGLEEVVRALEGQLTATIHATEEDLLRHNGLVDLLRRKVGRLIFNGYPTGVEVGPAMQHGGPYPATTDARTTSVGAAAILRFTRPVCYQDFPPQALPPELRDWNERGIWRMIDGTFTRDDVPPR